MIDKDTFCEQIRLHEKAMYYLAFSLVQNEADAADVIGEAILRAYKNIDGLKSEKAFKPWLLKIIHNTAVEYIRKNAKTISSQEIDVAVVVNYISLQVIVVGGLVCSCPVAVDWQVEHCRKVGILARHHNRHHIFRLDFYRLLRSDFLCFARFYILQIENLF